MAAEVSERILRSKTSRILITPLKVRAVDEEVDPNAYPHSEHSVTLPANEQACVSLLCTPLTRSY
jgi:hypothetical protein